jgi:hypothetical protein
VSNAVFSARRMYNLFRTLDLAEYYTNHNYGGFKEWPVLNVYNYRACDKMTGTYSPWPPWKAPPVASGNRRPGVVALSPGDLSMLFNCALPDRDLFGVFLQEARFGIRRRRPPCYSWSPSTALTSQSAVVHAGFLRGTVELDRSSNNVAYFCKEETDRVVSRTSGLSGAGRGLWKHRLDRLDFT